MNRILRLIGPVLVLAVFAAAVWLVFHELRNYRLSDIGAKIREIPAWRLVLAGVLTVVNYLILVGYDQIAIRFVGESLPLRRVALASFTGYACSYNFGATLAGTTVRLRLYSAWGMKPVKILELLVILGLTFWFGLFGLAGVLFITDPPHISPHPPAANGDATAGEHAPGRVGELGRWGAGDRNGDARHAKRQEVLDRILYFASNLRFWGVVLLSVGLAYLAVSATSLTHIKIFGHELPVPPLRLTLYQFGIVAADMLVAGAVVYCLMGHLPGVGTYTELLGIYMLVYVAVVLSHVPGGYGVFEAGMLFCLGRAAAGVPVPGDSVMAAIFVFRVIYFWAPLVLAIALLGINEIILRRRAAADEDLLAHDPGAAA